MAMLSVYWVFTVLHTKPDVELTKFNFCKKLKYVLCMGIARGDNILFLLLIYSGAKSLTSDLAPE